MNPSAPNSARLESLYSFALRFYPADFRRAYAEPMRQTFRDALSDSSLPRRTLLFTAVPDLVTSLAKEHLSMLLNTFARPALVFNALVLTALSTGLALALYSIPQQVLRQGANDPQIQMATDLAALLDRYGVTDGLHQGALLQSGGVVDMARSLSPFLIVYNDQGQALGSNAQLNGQTPAPPQGVFDYVRQHGEERISWQPILGGDHSVRIAAVVERVNGPQPGFVLAGRNMREVEAREHQVSQMAGLTWIGMLGVILVGTAAFGWYTRPKAA
ncbi:MAG: hypothetical protein P4L26_08085 [Terracidiphilus sp.]|nr:hypothetical protein [Terracidiphilus sp.]